MPEEKKCIQCGTGLPEDAMFCPECGTRQPAEPQQPVNVTEPADVAQSVDAVSMDAFSTESVSADVSPAESSMEKPLEPPATPVPEVVSAPEAKTPVQGASFDPFANAPPPKPVDPAQSFQYTMPAPPPEPAPPVYPQQVPPAQPVQQQWSQPPQQPPQQWQQMPAQPMPEPQAPVKGKGAGKKAAINGNAVPGEKPAGKLPVATLVILGLTLIGLVYWFLRYNSSRLPPFNFSAATANGVVFAFLLMSILAIAGAALFRFNMRGRKLAVLGDILLVIVLLVMFYGISVTMFKDTNMFYKLFIGITGGNAGG